MESIKKKVLAFEDKSDKPSWMKPPSDLKTFDNSTNTMDIMDRKDGEVEMRWRNFMPPAKADHEGDTEDNTIDLDDEKADAPLSPKLNYPYQEMSPDLAQLEREHAENMKAELELEQK